MSNFWFIWPLSLHLQVYPHWVTVSMKMCWKRKNSQDPIHYAKSTASWGAREVANNGLHGEEYPFQHWSTHSAQKGYLFLASGIWKGRDFAQGGTPDFKWPGDNRIGAKIKTPEKKHPYGPKFNPPKNPMPNFRVINTEIRRRDTLVCYPAFFSVKRKKQGWFCSREYKYIYIFFTNISEGAAFLLQGLTYKTNFPLKSRHSK